MYILIHIHIYIYVLILEKVFLRVADHCIVFNHLQKFLLGGRLIFGPDVRSLFVTLILIIAPVAVFCVFVARHLMNDFPNRSGIAIMVVAVVHTFIVRNPEIAVSQGNHYM